MKSRIIADKEKCNGPVFVGIALLLLVSPLLRGLFYEIEYCKAQMAIAIILFLFAFISIFQKRKEVCLGLQDYFALIFLLAYGLSPFFAVHLKEAVTGTFRVLCYVIVYFLAISVTKDAAKRKGMLTVIFISTVLVSIAAYLAAVKFMGFTITGEFSGSKRMISTLEYTNTFAIYSSVGIVIGLGLLQQTVRLPFRFLIAAGIYLNAIGVMATQSRGSWLILAFGLILPVFLLGRKYVWSYLLNVGIVLFAVIVSGKGFIDSFLLKTDQHFLYWLALGIVAVLLGVAISDQLPRLYNKLNMPPVFKQVMIWSMIALLIATSAYYFSYTSKYLPSPASQMLSDEVIERAASIGGQESSFKDRMAMKGTAWQIIKAHPLGTGEGGWEAYYHQFQEKLYWSSEVHDHFLQIWVEGGTLAFIAFVGFWLALFWQIGRRVVRYLAKDREYPSWPLFIGASAGLLILLLHSSFDFDLSLPAVSLTLWSLGAALRNDFDKPLFAKRITIPRIMLPVLSVMIAVFLFFPAFREYQAQVLMTEGEEAIAKQYHPMAIDKLEAALEISPYSGDTAAQLALEYANRYKDKPKEAYKSKTLEYAELAQRLHPNGVSTRWRIISALKMLNDKDTLLAHEEKLAELAPKWPLAWEYLSGSYFEQGMILLKEGRLSLGREQIEKAFFSCRKAEENYLGARKAYLTSPTAKTYLIAGQAAVILKDYEFAIKNLDQALRVKQTQEKAGLWLALVYRDSDIKKHNSLMAQYVNKNPEALKEYEEILKIFERI